jgi:hypothetical protein
VLKFIERLIAIDIAYQITHQRTGREIETGATGPENGLSNFKNTMVGATGIEPVTPTVSR